jgi:hypothetical protein
VGWGEQLGGAKDEQRRGDVADLERGHGRDQSAETTAQNWPYADAQREPIPFGR